MIDDSQISAMYPDLKRTRLGVLYLTRTIPIGTPKSYHDEILTGELTLLDESLMAMNLTGTAVGERRLFGTNDENFIYLIKIVPTFEKLSFRYFFTRMLVATVGLILINTLGLWDEIDKFFFDLWEQIKSWINSSET